MSRIAIFGGSFDPPHHGHIHLAVVLQEVHNIDTVYVIPAYRSPGKQARYSPEKRLKMTTLAFASVPNCKVLDIEISNKHDSFTIDTVQTLLEKDKAFAAAERFLFLGSDAVPTLPLWKDFQTLFTLVTPLIAARSNDCLLKLPPQLALMLAKGWTDSPILDISSTLIKERLLTHKYVAHLLPKDVLECLHEDE